LRGVVGADDSLIALSSSVIEMPFDGGLAGASAARVPSLGGVVEGALFGALGEGVIEGSSTGAGRGGAGRDAGEGAARFGAAGAGAAGSSAGFSGMRAGIGAC